MQDDNALWRFSLVVYSAPGVADECIALQDRHGLNVNLMLFCAWIGAECGVALQPEDIDGLHRTVDDWDKRVVWPLRNARRAMKAFPAAAPLRERVKALELDAERVEQAMLFDLAQSRWSAKVARQPSAVARNLDALFGVGLSAADAAPALVRAAEGYAA